MTVLLHGNDRLSKAIEERLIGAGYPVAKLHIDPDRQSPAIAHTTLEQASALIIAADDDPGNVDLALTTRRMRSDLPLVVRLFDEALATYIRDTLKGVTILSMSAISAPAFVDATQRALQEGAAHAAGKTQTPHRRDLPTLPRLGRPDRIVISAIGGLAAILTFFTLFFSNALGIPYVDSMYFVWTTITTVGYGDIALRDASSMVKVVGMVLMFSGAAFIAVLFGLFTDWVFSRRLDILRGRVWVRGSGHVVIAGGGNVGLRVAEGLAGLERRVVVIESNADNKNIAALRSSGHHVIVADAARDETLRLAKTEDAAAVLCLTDSDAINFQIALLVRARSKDVPIVMRVVSPELSAHISEHGSAVAISPIAIASERFVAAAIV